MIWAGRIQLHLDHLAHVAREHVRSIDEHAAATGLAGEIEPASRPAPTAVAGAGLELDLATYRSVVWATGFRPRYPWLDASFLDRRGRLAHDAGVAVNVWTVDGPDRIAELAALGVDGVITNVPDVARAVLSAG